MKGTVLRVLLLLLFIAVAVAITAVGIIWDRNHG